MSHLLIDRFRFDSFAPDSDEAGSNLLTRFGQIVYLFFMITPPASLVERAWKRGLEVGRYKAVDDTLAHSVEAYSGMPELFFTWVRRTDKRVHFEFLDNSVPLRRAAAHRRVRLERHAERAGRRSACSMSSATARVDIDATAPEFLYRDTQRAGAASTTPASSAQCVDRFGEVNFADQDTGRIYLRVVSASRRGSIARCWSARRPSRIRAPDWPTSHRCCSITRYPTSTDRTTSATSQEPRMRIRSAAGEPRGWRRYRSGSKPASRTVAWRTPTSSR